MEHPSLLFTDHRPWPLPAAPWRWRMAWRDLSFLHFRVRADAIQTRLPAGVTVQEFDGTAWVGVVPFYMAGVALGSLPSAPTVRHFPELNLRTYVERDGRPGVWFFSLDAASTAIVLGGRLSVGLPYFRASIRLFDTNGVWDCESRRGCNGVRYSGSVEPCGPEFVAAPGSFAHWATERYCLYTVRRGQLLRLQVHHAPWALREARADVRATELIASAGLDSALFSTDPVAHFSSGVEVVTWDPEVLATVP